MNKSVLLVFGVTVALVVILAGCSPKPVEVTQVIPTGVMTSPVGSSPTGTALSPTNSPGGLQVPPEYAGMTNPFANNPDAAAIGVGVYGSNCANCHGTDASGGRAPNLIDAVNDRGEDYIFWRISEGGGMPPFNSSMPAFKSFLSEDEIWQLITYLQSL